MRKTIQFDMDNVLVDFQTGIDSVPEYLLEEYEGRYDEIPGIFALMSPMPDALEAFSLLEQHYDCYLLSTAPWENPTAWSDKLEWVKLYLPQAYKRLTLSHNKQLARGDYLIDDRTANGAGDFVGEHIHFGQERFPDWQAVLDYLLIDDSYGE